VVTLAIQFKHYFISYLAVQKIHTYIAKQCSHVEFPYFVMGSHLGQPHSLATFTLKLMLRQMKNYGNSNISPCKNIIFKKSSKKKAKSFKIFELYN
jgi:hypothetical protein